MIPTILLNYADNQGNSDFGGAHDWAMLGSCTKIACSNQSHTDLDKIQSRKARRSVTSNA